ncbi:hypothetical protein C9J48_13060 [Photobacterium profundum]|uniref:Uncharacterized protein n=1 Tax=Photobacterium profundum 3TCK TaxID=314280 RepID=Q1Z0G9_9GAMM|nr:hypothetical protein [Photobacterium profundum]EAS42003.1 hypothetical protein P3TCK_11849 [Photobacterium profundum 3TCK]PSV61918.1 hypothetical protein C9J48_13060 [Photobacterium profundum]
MRKTNLALLVAIVVSSPAVFAYGGGGYNPPADPVSSGNNNTDTYKDNVGNKDIVYTSEDSHDLKLDVDDSFNHEANYETTTDTETNYTKNVSYSSDDDTLRMNNVNNDESYYNQDNSDNSKVWNESLNVTEDISWDVNLEENHYVSTSYLSGYVTDNEVTYGGACCDDGGHGGGYGHRGGYNDDDDGMSGDFFVDQSNSMMDSFNGSSGISMAGQNAGNNSMLQQSASTNAVLVGY